MPNANIQQALAALQNPAAMRQAVLSRLNLGAQAPSVGGLGANYDYDKNINDLYRQGAETAGSLDTSEGNLKTNTKRSLAKAAIDRDRALEAIKGGFAMRGMSFSGANVDEQNRTMGDFSRYTDELTADETSGLTDIANRRDQLIEMLTRGRNSAEQGLTSSVSDWLREQAVGAWVNQQQQNDLQTFNTELMRQASLGGGTPRTATAPRPATPAPVKAPATPGLGMYPGAYGPRIPTMPTQRPQAGAFAGVRTPRRGTGGGTRMAM